MNMVNVTIHWVGQSFEGQAVNHQIDVVAPGPVSGM